jgi:hypothetical protein
VPSQKRAASIAHPRAVTEVLCRLRTEVVATLYTFPQTLAYAGPRCWEIGYPGYTSLTIYERRMLNLIAAAQSDDAKGFETCLHVLAHPTLRHALGIAARALGAALDEHDLRLPYHARFFSRLLRERANPGMICEMVPFGDQKGTR